MRTSPFPSSITFAGFRSRCSTPFSCAAATPAHSCRAICTALSGGIRPNRRSDEDEILAVHVLHREEATAVGFPEVVEPADVLVGDLSRDPQLVVELRDAGIGRRDAFWQELQRDGLVSVKSSARYTSPMPPRPSSATSL